MNTASILIKIDPQVKMEAQKVAEAMGLSLTSVINRYLKHFITAKTITFSARNEEPSEYLLQAIKEAKEDLKTGKASPTFDNAEDAIKWLNR